MKALVFLAFWIVLALLVKYGLMDGGTFVYLFAAGLVVLWPFGLLRLVLGLWMMVRAFG